MSVLTLGQSILKVTDYGWTNPAIISKKNEHWNHCSWQHYLEKIIDTSSSFVEIGVLPESKVAIMAETRFEWVLCDLAICLSGGISVPINSDSTTDEIEYILKHSGASILICGNNKAMSVWAKISNFCPSVQTVIGMENEYPHIDNITTCWSKFIARGSTNRLINLDKIKYLVRQQKLDDIFTIVYTSGTSGPPKGVVLTQTQITCQINETYPLFKIGPKDITLTYLPLAHIVARIEYLGHIYFGYTVSFAESINHLKTNLVEIKPTIMAAVPRVFEKIYATIQHQAKANPLRLAFFNWSVKVGLIYSNHVLSNKKPSLLLRTQHYFASKMALEQIKNIFGGRLKFSVCGGASLKEDVFRFFHAAQVLILEGYGLTETTGAISINSPQHFRFGTAGLPIGEAKFKIESDGEILIKSKKNMKEYYKDPASSSAALKDGWLHTGDLGEITDCGEVRFIGRKKDTFKLSNGKHIVPQKIEDLIKENPLVSQAVVFGENEKFAIALITLDAMALTRWCSEHRIAPDFADQVVQGNDLKKTIHEAIKKANTRLSRHETVKRFEIINPDFAVETGELTGSLKVKRNFVYKKYRDVIKKIYE